MTDPEEETSPVENGAFDALLAEAESSVGSDSDSSSMRCSGLLSMWALLLPAMLLLMFAAVYVLRSPSELGALGVMGVIAAAALRPSLVGVAQRTLSTARSTSAARRAAAKGTWDAAGAGEAAVMFSCSAHALVYLGGAALLYSQVLPNAARMLELTALLEPTLVVAVAVLAPAMLLWAQAQSSKRFGLGF